MPLEPHHEAREESTGGTATQLQGPKLSPLAVAQIGQDSKLRCSRKLRARSESRRDIADAPVYAAADT